MVPVSFSTLIHACKHVRLPAMVSKSIDNSGVYLWGQRSRLSGGLHKLALARVELGAMHAFGEVVTRIGSHGVCL